MNQPLVQFPGSAVVWPFPAGQMLARQNAGFKADASPAPGRAVNTPPAATLDETGSVEGVDGADGSTACPHDRIDECASLLGAVEARLRTAVDGPAREAGSPASSASSASSGTRQVVLECAQTLGQLQALLAAERRRFARIQAVAEDVRERLAQAQQDLDTTRQGERQAHHRALHDGLTTLPNRSFFQQRLEAALAVGPSAAEPGAPTLAVLYVDLDDMKAVNDRHGHAAGDEVLRVIAARLVHAVREGDMVSRQGGDEFALLIADLPAHQLALPMVADLAHKLCLCISAPLSIGALEVSVHASIGVALHPDHGDCAETLLRHADAAMYRAKRGQHRYALFDGSAPG